MIVTPVILNRPSYFIDNWVQSVVRSVGYLLMRRRNAWHSTTINQYRSSEPMFTDLPSACAAAESRREQGTYFEIVEVPLLAFRIGFESLLVAQLNVSRPFAGWKLPETLAEGDLPITIRDVVQAFGEGFLGEKESGWPPRADALTVIIGEAEFVDMAPSAERGPFTVHQSAVKSGSMYFTAARTEESDVAEIDRIVAELSSRTEREIQVFELAGQLGVTSAEVLRILRSIDITLWGPNAVVQPDDASLVRYSLTSK